MDKHRRRQAVELTSGSIPRGVLRFALPILAGYIFQTLYNNVDSLVVGNFVGKEALAAVNACTPIYNLLVGFFIGMSTGASVIFSRSLGEENYGRLRDAVHTTVFFTLVLGLVLGTAGTALVPLMLRILKCRADIIGLAGEYLRIYMAGIVFTAFYNVGAAVLRSVGDSQSPFTALLISSFTNIALDLLFVCVFHWGVAGVAAATVLAQVFSVAMVFFQMAALDPRYRLEFSRLHIDWGLLREILTMGLPAGFQSSLIAVSNIFVNRYINSISSDLMAGVGVAQKVDRFINMPCQALGLAATTFVSQNIGARKKERIRRGVATCFAIGLVSIAVTGGVICLTAPGLMRLFNRDSMVVQYGSDMMRTLAPLYVLCLTTQVASGLLRGFGYSRQVSVLSLMGMVVIRQIFLAAAMPVWHSPFVIYIGYPVGWFFDALNNTLFALFLYRRGTLAKVFDTNS